MLILAAAGPNPEAELFNSAALLPLVVVSLLILFQDEPVYGWSCTSANNILPVTVASDEENQARTQYKDHRQDNQTDRHAYDSKQ